MVKLKLVLFFAIFLCVLASFALADQTQLYSKILVSPFYRDTLAQNVVYNYTIEVNPPDKVTQVYSAIIYWQVNMIPTLGLTMKVNNQTCNTPTYNISTTYAGTSQVMASFDCSNIITKAGSYNVTLVASRATGAITGWLDLTYTNKPIASMDVFGTEYQAGDDGTIFLLLKDANGIPISNATCILDIYLPLSANNTHAEWIDDGLMRYLEEGLYYYDFIAPLFGGIYMVNAKCTYVTSGNQYYTLSSGLSPTRNATIGTYTGDPFVLNDFSEWLYTQCDSGIAGGGGKSCDSWYQWNLTAGGLSGNATQLFVQYLGECNGANPLTQYWFNWSETNTSKQWIKLPNNLTFSATASSGVPIGVDEYLSNNVPLQAISNTSLVRIRTLTTSGSTFKLWSNMLVLKAVQYGTTIQDLKGSGEIHINSNPAGKNNYFQVDTCDGYVDGRCSIFTNDDEFDLVEGEIEDFLNISATSTRADLPIHYETPFAVDCTALYWIKEWNGTDWVDFTDYITYSQPSYQNCIVTLYKNVTTGTDYQFWMKMDNYMIWEVDYTEQITKTITDLIVPLCDNRNFSYETPITDTTNISNDSITDFCHRAYDDFYWISTYYNDSLGVSIAGEYASYLQEMRFYRQELFNRYDLLSKVTDNSSQTIISMLGNLTNMTFGNLSFINNQLLNISAELNIHKGLIQDIIDFLNNTIYPYLQQMWNKLLGLETQLNTTINITTNINNTANLIKNDTTTIINKINDLNVSMTAGFAEKDAHIQNAYDNMSSQVNNLSQNMTSSFNYTWSLIQLINQSASNNSEILSYLANITITLNNTQTQLANVNQSLTEQIINSTNNTNILINNLNISSQSRFDQLQSYLDNLTIQISQNHNITQSNITDLQNLMLAVNLSLTTDISNLNVSLYDVRTDLLTEINQSYQYMIAMNLTITNELALINTSLSSAIQTFRSEVQSNFSNMFSTLAGISNDLNGTKADLLSKLTNLSIQIENTNQSIQFKLDALNISMQSGFAEKDAHIQSAYDNITSQINNLSNTWSGNFSQVLDRLDNLSTQVSSNHNITQGNLSAINSYLLNLNTSVQQGFIDLNTSIGNAQQNLSNQINLVNSSLSQSIADFRAESQANFTQVFFWLQSLNASQTQANEKLDNLSIQLNNTRTEILSRIDSVNQTLTLDLQNIKNDTTTIIQLVNDLNLSLNNLNGSFTDTTALILSAYGNLTNQVNANTTTILNALIATNASLSADIALVKNDTQNTINLINLLDAKTDSQYQNLTIFISNLDTQISLNHNITQSNLSTLFAMLTAMNLSETQEHIAINNSLTQLGSDVYGYYVDLNNTITSKIDALNLSFQQEISAFKNETSGNFNTSFLLLTQLSGDLNSTKSEIRGDISNLSTQLNDTRTEVLQQMNYLNVSMQAGFAEKDAHIQSAYDNITSQISNLSLVWDGNFTQILNRLDNLSVQVDTNHNITQSNISAINNYLLNLNTSIQQGFIDLNTSIGNAETNILSNLTAINSSLSDLILLINQSLSQSIVDTQTNLLLINTSLAQKIDSLQTWTEGNFNTTFLLLNGLEGQNNLTHALLGNLSLELNATKWEIFSHIDLINDSLFIKMDGVENKTDYAIALIQNLSLQMNASNQDVLDYLNSMNTNITNNFGAVDNQFNITQQMILNVTQTINFTPVLSAINNLSIQVDTNHNITQSNITQIFNRLDGLNDTCTQKFDSLNSSITNFSTRVDNYMVWLNGTLVEMKSEISNIENMTYIINQTTNQTNTMVIWIINQLNITTENLSLSAEAPQKCLEGTNWLLKAQVKNRYGVILSPLDNMQCNVTTDLWGVSNMTYSYVEQKYKYTHLCNPAYTIFNWSVACDYTS